VPLTMTRRCVTFEVHGTAQPKGSAKAFVPFKWAAQAVSAAKTTGKQIPPRAVITQDNTRSKGWEQLVAEQAQTVAADGAFFGPVVLAVTFALPRPHTLPQKIRHHVKLPDLDKLLRSVLDALTGVLYLDDKQVVEVHARKYYVRPPAGPSARITLADAAPPEPGQVDLLDMAFDLTPAQAAGFMR